MMMNWANKRYVRILEMGSSRKQSTRHFYVWEELLGGEKEKKIQRKAF